jgi:hypothetical protein
MIYLKKSKNLWKSQFLKLLVHIKVAKFLIRIQIIAHQKIIKQIHKGVGKIHKQKMNYKMDREKLKANNKKNNQIKNNKKISSKQIREYKKNRTKIQTNLKQIQKIRKKKNQK